MIINKIIPLLELDFGTKKFYYAAESIKIQDTTTYNFYNYKGNLKNEGGISRSFSINDFKSSTSVASNITIINTDRLQDHVMSNMELATSARYMYLSNQDKTSIIDEISGCIGAGSWDINTFSLSVKDSQKLLYKNVPEVILDDKSFQASFNINDPTITTTTVTLDGVVTTIIKNIASDDLAGRPDNFWKGARIDVVDDRRPSDDPLNASGQFAVIVSSAGTTVYLNDVVDEFLQDDGQTARDIINNTLKTCLDPDVVTFQIVKNSLPQNSESVGTPVPIIYGEPEKVPLVWAIGQKSTRTNSFGVGDDIYLMASHRCKLGAIPDATISMQVYQSTGSPPALSTYNNGVYNYSDSDLVEIDDGLRAEVYWSLEDKRVVDARITPGNRNWIPNPFPKVFRGSVYTGQAPFVDDRIRLVSPIHKIKFISTLRGENITALQLRGGEFDWFDATPALLDYRAQYPIRYGIGNSKLYASFEGYADDADGYYTGSTFDQYDTNDKSVLIKNPADIILHFLLNYTSLDGDKSQISVDDFRKTRQALNRWRFDTAITEIISGETLIDRWCYQSCSILLYINGLFVLKPIILEKLVPKLYLREGEHIFSQKFEVTKVEDIYNNFLFSYKYDHPNSKYSAVLKRDKSNDQKCRNSYSINGFERSKANIELPDISDEYTVNKYADNMVDIYSKRRTYMTASVVYSDEFINSKIDIGDSVAITSSLAPGGWVEKNCLIIDMRKTLEFVEFKLMEI